MRLFKGELPHYFFVTMSQTLQLKWSIKKDLFNKVNKHDIYELSVKFDYLTTNPNHWCMLFFTKINNQLRLRMSTSKLWMHSLGGTTFTIGDMTLQLDENFLEYFNMLEPEKLTFSMTLQVADPLRVTHVKKSTRAIDFRKTMLVTLPCKYDEICFVMDGHTVSLIKHDDKIAIFLETNQAYKMYYRVSGTLDNVIKQWHQKKQITLFGNNHINTSVVNECTASFVIVCFFDVLNYIK